MRAVARRRRCSGDVVLKPRDPAALASFDTAVSTPGSPTFRHYLAPRRVRGDVRTGSGHHRAPPGPGSRGGASRSAPRQATAWSSRSRARPTGSTRPSASGSEQYRLPSGRIVRVPDAEPLVPSSLAGALRRGDRSRRPEQAPSPSRSERDAVAAPTTSTPADRAQERRSLRAPPGRVPRGPLPPWAVRTRSSPTPAVPTALTVDQLAPAYSVLEPLCPATRRRG